MFKAFKANSNVRVFFKCQTQKRKYSIEYDRLCIDKGENVEELHRGN